jgi:hypothetical protein
MTGDLNLDGHNIINIAMSENPKSTDVATAGYV